HMKAGYDSGKPAPTPTPILVDPNDDGIWDNNADISWIDPSKPMIAFTFDDGPVGTSDTASSIRIQNALAASGQHATFFYWGSHINSGNSAEIKRAYELGFEIGNHTFSHPNLTGLTADKILENVTKCAEKLTEITGLEHFLVRPPYLATNATVKAAVFEPMINCSIDSKDWDGATTEQIINTINTQKKDGAIVLMHETYTTTAEAMELLIPQLVADGWQIVSVSELFKAKNLDLLDGSVYNYAN
ncbi:MAG: polysaccharide deacetylase family protein, partial [Lachnospiraceae bacterium]